MFCPNYKNKEVFNDFNKIIESFGGQPLSKSEFISKTLRAERYGRNKFAMDAAYFLWDKTQGDMQVLARDEDFINNKVNGLIPIPEDVLNIEEVEEFISEIEEKVEQEEEIRGEEEINYSQRNIIEYNKSLENVPEIFPSEENVSNNKEELKKVTNNIKPELANAVYKAAGLNTINRSEITYTDEEGNPCAKMGLTNATKGTGWKIVKDFKGQPKHSQGGVDITISDNGVSMRRGGKDIKAKYGLLIPNNN